MSSEYVEVPVENSIEMAMIPKSDWEKLYRSYQILEFLHISGIIDDGDIAIAEEEIDART